MISIFRRGVSWSGCYTKCSWFTNTHTHSAVFPPCHARPRGPNTNAAVPVGCMQGSWKGWGQDEAGCHGMGLWWVGWPCWWGFGMPSLGA